MKTTITITDLPDQDTSYEVSISNNRVSIEVPQSASPAQYVAAGIACLAVNQVLGLVEDLALVARSVAFFGSVS